MNIINTDFAQVFTLIVLGIIFLALIFGFLDTFIKTKKIFQIICDFPESIFLMIPIMGILITPAFICYSLNVAVWVYIVVYMGLAVLPWLLWLLGKVSILYFVYIYRVYIAEDMGLTKAEKREKNEN